MIPRPVCALRVQLLLLEAWRRGLSFCWCWGRATSCLRSDTSSRRSCCSVRRCLCSGLRVFLMLRLGSRFELSDARLLALFEVGDEGFAASEVLDRLPSVVFVVVASPLHLILRDTTFREALCDNLLALVDLAAGSKALVGVRLTAPLPFGFGGAGGAATFFAGAGPRLPQSDGSSAQSTTLRKAAPPASCSSLLGCSRTRSTPMIGTADRTRRGAERSTERPTSLASICILLTVGTRCVLKTCSGSPKKAKNVT
ncbi:hypothetical protein OAO87_02290 [bacterium]|nr:hypothetical protein [bacterium]